jgi:hypothetical protein
MPTLQQAASRLSRAVRRFNGYNNELKKEFGSAAKSFLRAWAKKNAVAGEIHWNKGGIAVSGEVRLTNATFEVEVSQSLCDIPCIMFRGRKQDGFYNQGRKQLPRYVTGSNNFATPEKFITMSMEVFLQMCGREFMVKPPIIMANNSTYAWDMTKGPVSV